ncbi:zinc-ribbon domain-containing protein [Bacillus salipaludis]|uniref:Zinc-ribbon domain-containing protein n=1 Tax=Bacillus salipaludis TaxID=2547811 RepID=A0AA90QZH1_9BACI|nr:zinc-ribbon domain-containing protein [Bacillus salipaludis]MDQ6598087.1 zinc-ribbon domain-containing protein [Bacillus salipaludis]
MVDENRKDIQSVLRKPLFKQSLLFKNPTLASEWDMEKNFPLTQADVNVSYEGKVGWKCIKNHSWEAIVRNRNKGNGCPECNDERKSKRKDGEPSLKEVYPQIAKEWHPTKNNISIKDVRIKSNKKLWWRCVKGHEWQTTVSNRTRDVGGGCPYCSGYYASPENNLQAIHPVIAREWHPTLNSDTPYDVTPMSKQKRYWLCHKGHITYLAVQKKVVSKACPDCLKKEKTSFPEWVIYFYVNKVFKRAQKGVIYNSPSQFHLDCLIEDINLAIEYDGSFFHRDVERDIRKDRSLKNNRENLILIRFREDGCPEYTSPNQNVHFWQVQKSESSLRNNIQLLFRWIEENIKGIPHIEVDIDIDRDRTEIRDLIVHWEKANSLEKSHPELVVQWHPTQNGTFKPSHITKGSDEKVCWQCDSGHSWQATVSSRVAGSGCPYCSNRYIGSDNNITITHPEIADQWHPELNGEHTPDLYSSGNSYYKAWWKCLKDSSHAWQALISSRIKDKSGFPFCSGHKATHHNNLAITHPDIAMYWNWELNTITPFEVKRFSNRKVWWRCDISPSHVWEAVISHRTEKSGCPYCTNKIVSDENNLAVTHPQIAEEWHSKKNGTITPREVTKGSDKRIWWVCSERHEWQTKVYNRTKINGTNCPKCSKMKKRFTKDSSLNESK